MLHAYKFATSQPWMVTEDFLKFMLEISLREHTPDFEAVAAKKEKYFQTADLIRGRDGVAVIHVLGPIFRHANFFTEISGGTTVARMAREFSEALESPEVEAIAFNIDSPGGEVTGIAEFSQMIYSARGKKPIIAYGDGMVASAAYFIASAADEIVIDSTSVVGSIGVVATLPDPDARRTKEIVFVSSGSERKRPDIKTVEGAAQIQELVDHLAEVFVNDVARNRGVLPENVLADFGQGGVMVGRRAVESGLADSLGSFEAVVSALASGRNLIRRSHFFVSASEEDNSMTRYERLKASLAAIIKAEDIKEGDPIPGAIEAQKEALALDAQIPLPITELDRINAAKEQATLRARIEAVEQENKELRAQTRIAETTKLSTEAAAYVDGAIRENKVLPAERDVLINQYIQASKDDEHAPLGANVTRLGFIKLAVESRTPHTLTSERLSNDHDIRIDPKGTDPNDTSMMTEHREAELLRMSVAGRAILRDQGKA